MPDAQAIRVERLEQEIAGFDRAVVTARDASERAEAQQRGDQLRRELALARAGKLTTKMAPTKAFLRDRERWHRSLRAKLAYERKKKAMQTKAEKIAELRAELERQQGGLVEMREKITAQELELEKRQRRYAEAATGTRERIAELEEQIRKEESEGFRAEFFALAADLDKHGESPQRLARWLWLCGVLRSAGLMTVSHWRVRLTLDQLRASNPKNQPLPLALRSWSAIARNWVRQPQQENAA
jgi:hypothetical protein